MTDSTMLRQAAIGKLMDVQEYCNWILAERDELMARAVAISVLDIIKDPS